MITQIKAMIKAASRQHAAAAALELVVESYTPLENQPMHGQFSGRTQPTAVHGLLVCYLYRGPKKGQKRHIRLTVPGFLNAKKAIKKGVVA